MMRTIMMALVAFMAFAQSFTAYADEFGGRENNVGTVWVPAKVPSVPFRDLFFTKSAVKSKVVDVRPEQHPREPVTRDTTKVTTVPQFVGIAFNDKRQAFFLQGDEHIVARDNDLISKRYRVIRIERDRVLLKDVQTGLERTVLAK